MTRAWVGRKLLHISVGSAFPILALFFPLKIIIPLLIIVTAAYLAFDLARLGFPVISRLPLFNRVALKKQETKGLTGSTFLLLSSLLVFCVFKKEIAIISILFLSFGDPIASLVGEMRGRKRLWGKSIEGSLSFFLTASLIGLLLTPILGISPLIILVGAIMATFIELLPLPLDDNLIIPPFAAGVMTLIYYWQGA